MHVQRFCPSRVLKCASIPIALSLFVLMSFFGVFWCFFACFRILCVFSYRFVSWTVIVSSCNSPVASCGYCRTTRRLFHARVVLQLAGCSAHAAATAATALAMILAKFARKLTSVVTLGCHGERKVPQDGVDGAILFGDCSLQGARLPVEVGLEPVEALSETAGC
jgi:hypothetical protein